MAWLILVVCGSGIVNIRHLVESELTVVHRLVERRNLSIVVFFQLHHARMSGFVLISVVQSAAACDHLQPRVDHSRKESMFEGLMEVTNFPEFLFNPALLDEFFKPFQFAR